MIYGMPTLIELNRLEDTMSLCKELGLSFLELNMNLPMYQTEKLENTDFLLKMKEKYGVYYTIHLDENLNIADFNSLVTKAYLETVKRTIEVAKKLDVPVINMHMNHGIYFTLPDRKVQLYEQYKETYLQSIVTFRQMCEEAIGNEDISICIENKEGFRSYEREAIKELLQSKVFALTWDIGHSHAVKNIDEPFLMNYENRLKHFHIHDGSNEKNHMALGTGEIDLIQRLDLAKKNHCRCVLETKTIKALRESVQWIQKNYIEE